MPPDRLHSSAIQFYICTMLAGGKKNLHNLLLRVLLCSYHGCLAFLAFNLYVTAFVLITSDLSTAIYAVPCNLSPFFSNRHSYILPYLATLPRVRQFSLLSSFYSITRIFLFVLLLTLCRICRIQNYRQSHRGRDPRLFCCNMDIPRNIVSLCASYL